MLLCTIIVPLFQGLLLPLGHGVLEFARLPDLVQETPVLRHVFDSRWNAVQGRKCPLELRLEFPRFVQHLDNLPAFSSFLKQCFFIKIRFSNKNINNFSAYTEPSLLLIISFWSSILFLSLCISSNLKDLKLCELERYIFILAAFLKFLTLLSP